MWTVENRARCKRDHLRYPSDLTDEEGALVEPLIPPGKPGGGKRRVKLREVVNGLMYVLSTGCQWRAIPKDRRRARRSTTISTCGPGTARSTASITPSTSPAGSRRHVKPRPAPRSLTARA